MSQSLRTRPVRFTVETLAAVDAQADAAGLTPSAFIRAAVDENLGRPDSSAPAVADLTAEVAELRALRQEWQRQMSSVGTRLALLPPAPPPSNATPPPADESGLTEPALS
jgi:hypothetical protein